MGKTIRETPRNAGTIGQQLLLRAGFVRAAGPGLFVVLPLGGRVLERARSILTSEASALGIQMLETPPPLLATLKERAGVTELKRALASCRPRIRRQYFMAAQHEDHLCSLAGGLPKSHKELPLLLASNPWLLREESRDLTSLTWARQFPAHFGYSFDTDQALAVRNYAQLRAMCRTALEKMGLEIVSAKRHPSAPQAPVSEDFVALSEEGEDDFIVCGTCGYSARLEEAQSLFPAYEQREDPRPMETIFGPGIVSTAELASFAGIDHRKTTKTLFFHSDDILAAACVRGEYDISEAKLAALLDCQVLKLAPPGAIRDLTGAEVGYAGPIGLPENIRTLWDLTTENRVNFEAGANRTDHHHINLNFDRDVPKPQEFVDLRRIQQGETCMDCGRGELKIRKGTIAGHISQPGTLYSRELKAVYTSSGGQSEPMVMTCYGIDLLRLLAAVAGGNRDGKGILWPACISPFQAHLISLPGVEDRAVEIYEKVRQEGVDIIWDSRDLPAGARFGDADLIGIPVRLVISSRTGDKIEWKARNSDSSELLSPEDVLQRLLALR